MQFYLPPRGRPAYAVDLLLGPPLATQIHRKFTKNGTCACSVRKGARRTPLNAKKRTFGGPRVPQGAKMEPKWNQIGHQNVLKIEVSVKSVENGLDPLFTVYTHYRHHPKTSLFDTWKQAKCKSFPRGASDTVPELQSAAHEAEK